MLELFHFSETKNCLKSSLFSINKWCISIESSLLKIHFYKFPIKILPFTNRFPNKRKVATLLLFFNWKNFQFFFFFFWSKWCFSSLELNFCFWASNFLLLLLLPRHELVQFSFLFLFQLRFLILILRKVFFFKLEQSVNKNL